MARRILQIMVAFLLCNSVFWWQTAIPGGLKVFLLLALLALFLWGNISPIGGKGLPGKLKSLGAGCALLLTLAVCAVMQVLCYGALLLTDPGRFRLSVWIWGGVVSFLVLAVLLTHGAVRIFVVSGQLTATDRVLLLLLWWMPVVNIFVFVRVFRRAHREFRFLLEKYRRDQARAAEKICETAYPLLLVHGIFFRDWKLFNYWGRVPKALEENGATVFYGEQQSSTSVEHSAGELRDCILRLIEEQGCEKVNIIAHSKGGLDARYAISCLGMDAHVASLTTINTPHHGCPFARKALEKMPEKIVAGIGKQYDMLFQKLGDDQPDFFSGVSELTDEKCEELNETVPDREGIYYQSVGSYMRNAQSAMFPLNVGYRLVHAVDGDNDGLVALRSMPWGENFIQIDPPGPRGLSHGDMIDLTRKDIPGFDVCEFYVQLVHGLKERGL